ncbi:response regulator transcription factor [Diplocloster modestus]|uniref:Stage 0 sporulation protein A homolog n=1 Tax=Diplocloster modestus TaxID=2850322 RepID=A0ABS6K4M9_9FIRM|nr:response regulator transcription factor [Diplocloster modestus]MBU9725489.1 response regulator transcription factor [Diplocloster modestus]
MERLLFVDDDADLLDMNKIYFEKLGYLVDIALGAEDALHFLSEHHYKCIVLDIRMDDVNGLDLCRLIRQKYRVPIIFLTSLTEEEIMIEGFECGGDDYLLKPYRMKELEMRVRARIRNTNPLAPARSLTCALQLNPEEKQAYIGGKSLNLTVNEYEILQFLAQHKGTPYRQEAIYQALWGEDYYNTHSIQILVMRIRRKIQALSPDKEYIKTQWGKGYIYTE